MRIDLAGVATEVIGDPHLGRKFETGVPMDRRGDREMMVYADFDKRMQTEAGFMICMGDLFDKFVVAPEIELFAADEFKRGKARMKFVLRGNHDASRDAKLSSSFDVFYELVKDIDGVVVIKERPMIVQVTSNPHRYIVLIPWHPFKDAKQMASDCLAEWNVMGKPEVLAAFGHWDTQDFSEFGGNASNLVPVGILRQMTKTIYTGHVHTPGIRMIGDIKLISTGSMQPYTHGEDPDGTMYETLTLEELRQRDPASLRDKCIRVELEQGEELPNDIEALQVTRYVKQRKDGEEPEQVRVESFDLMNLFDEAMAKVPPATAAKIKDKFQELMK